MTEPTDPRPRSLVQVVTRGSLGADPAAFIVLEVRDAFRARGLDPDPATLLRAMAEIRATAGGWDPADDSADVEDYGAVLDFSGSPCAARRPWSWPVVLVLGITPGALTLAGIVSVALGALPVLTATARSWAVALGVAS